MRRGFKCRKDVIEKLTTYYDSLTKGKYKGSFLKSLKNFEFLAENEIRRILGDYYDKERSRNQAWRSCKGELYEYAVFRFLKQIIGNDEHLKNKIDVVMGDEALSTYKDQIVIRNWSDILPDADIVLVDKINRNILAILSCKTSLRERLTETAFWKRELEKTKANFKIKLIFVTTDKDNELRTETNRYILLHVVDYTFITDPKKYDELINSYKAKYGKRDDFNELLSKVKPIDEFGDFIYTILQ